MTKCVSILWTSHDVKHPKQITAVLLRVKASRPMQWLKVTSKYIYLFKRDCRIGSNIQRLAQIDTNSKKADLQLASAILFNS